MWIVVGYVARITGLGKAVSLLIVLASFAAVLTGVYVGWRHQIISANNLLWEQRMSKEKQRVEAILIEERLKSAERITAMLKKQITLQEQIDADEQIIDASPDRDAIGIGADSVSRIDRIH